MLDLLLKWPNTVFIGFLLLSGFQLVRIVFFHSKRIKHSNQSNGIKYEGAILDRSPEAAGLYSDNCFDEELELDHQGHTSRSSLLAVLNLMSKSRFSPDHTVLLLFAFWGASGLLINELLQKIFHEPLVYFWLSAVLAMIVAIAVIRVCSSLILKSDFVKKKRGLIGCEGRAMDRVTLESGMAQILDERGALHRVFCRIEPDGYVIQEGDTLRVVGYDSEEGRYLVKRSPN